MLIKKTFRNITAGDSLVLHASEHTQNVTFLGFTDWDEAHGKGGPKFINWKAVAEGKGLASFAALDKAEEERDYGRTIYAAFRDVDGDYTFNAYRFNGRWTIGSGADPVSLFPTPEEEAAAEEQAALARAARSAAQAEAREMAAPMLAEIHAAVRDGNVDRIKALRVAIGAVELAA